MLGEFREFHGIIWGYVWIFWRVGFKVWAGGSLKLAGSHGALGSCWSFWRNCFLGDLLGNFPLFSTTFWGNFVGKFWGNCLWDFGEFAGKFLRLCESFLMMFVYSEEADVQIWRRFALKFSGIFMGIWGILIGILRGIILNIFHIFPWKLVVEFALKYPWISLEIRWVNSFECLEIFSWKLGGIYL